MKRILVIDDSPINLDLIVKALESTYEVVEMKNGAEALEYLQKNHVDLVLLDIVMQEMDVFAACDKIRKTYINRNTPVVFLTEQEEGEMELNGLRMGAVDFIHIPFVPEIMLHRVKRILQLEELAKNMEEMVKEKTGQIEQLSFEIISTIAGMIEAKVKKTESTDVLTGLWSRKEGEKRIIRSMKQKAGCLAFIDLDNLKRTNDTMGHLAGDYALKTVGEVLSKYDKNAVMLRMGGDEFAYYMAGVNKAEAETRISRIIDDFEEKRKQSTYLSVSTLSIGLCMTTEEDVYTEVLKKADRALYYVKQSGKCGYYFYNNDINSAKNRHSVDLKRLVENLKAQGAYKGTLNVEYREFAKIYDYVQHLGDRYQYNIKLVLITLDFAKRENMYIDERERAMTCMEKAIQASLRSVDVCTRFSGEQFVVILMNSQAEYTDMITGRIAVNFHRIYDPKMIEVQFDVADLSSEEYRE